MSRRVRPSNKKLGRKFGSVDNRYQAAEFKPPSFKPLPLGSPVIKADQVRDISREDAMSSTARDRINDQITREHDPELWDVWTTEQLDRALARDKEAEAEWARTTSGSGMSKTSRTRRWLTSILGRFAGKG